MADIDECEKNQDLAYKVNVNLTKALVEAGEKIFSRFIFCSTDTVFDGKKGMYTEIDIPIPVNYYAKTKLEARILCVKGRHFSYCSKIIACNGLPCIRSWKFVFIAYAKKDRRRKACPYARR
jgi:nucleoside-diphosphate-sugar epimerase